MWLVLFIAWPVYVPLLYWVGARVSIDGVPTGRLRWPRTASYDVLPGVHAVEIRGGFLGGVAAVGIRAQPGGVTVLDLRLASRWSDAALDGRVGTIFPAELYDLRQGDRVSHTQWGPGSIRDLEAEITSEGGVTVPARAFARIAFDDGHIRTIDLDVEELRDI